MDELVFLNEYFERYRKALFDNNKYDTIIKVRDVLIKANEKENKIIFAGNGASAAIASHAALDFTKQGKIRSISFNEASLITCFANDYGYEYWLQKALEFYAEPGDIVVLISSSGRSPNIVNAAEYSKNAGLTVVTFTGVDNNNPLKSLGDIHFWVNSKAYNVIENIHQIWLMTICDLIVGKAEYSVV